jgi:hypothetical protein
LKFRYLLFSIALSSGSLLAQTPPIKIHGKLSGPGGLSIPNYVMVVNLKTGNGHFIEADGTFEITANRKDTIAFASLGYYSYKICFKDSVIKTTYKLNISLRKAEYQLKEITVTQDKTLDEIRNNLSKLGQKTKEVKQHETGISSPVAFLYEEFSSRERSKRKLAELQDEDQRRAVLKDFIRICIKSHLIDLKEEKIDDFMDFFNVTDTFLNSSSDYEIMIAIKEKYGEFQKLPIK